MTSATYGRLVISLFASCFPFSVFALPKLTKNKASHAPDVILLSRFAHTYLSFSVRVRVVNQCRRFDVTIFLLPQAANDYETLDACRYIVLVPTINRTPLNYIVQVGEEAQKSVIQRIFQQVAQRPDSFCNYLEGIIPEWGEGTKLIYRHYATLYFVFAVDAQESDLGILDLVQGETSRRPVSLKYFTHL